MEGLSELFVILLVSGVEGCLLSPTVNCNMCQSSSYTLLCALALYVYQRCDWPHMQMNHPFIQPGQFYMWLKCSTIGSGNDRNISVVYESCSHTAVTWSSSD